MQAAIEKEYAEAEAKAMTEGGGDDKMQGTDDKDDDAVSETGSEDLEAESSDEDDEEDEEDAGEGEGDEDVEMGDDKPGAETNGTNAAHAVPAKQEVMAH